MSLRVELHQGPGGNFSKLWHLLWSCICLFLRQCLTLTDREFSGRTNKSPDRFLSVDNGTVAWWVNMWPNLLEFPHTKETTATEVSDNSCWQWNEQSYYGCVPPFLGFAKHLHHNTSNRQASHFKLPLAWTGFHKWLLTWPKWGGFHVLHSINVLVW